MGCITYSGSVVPDDERSAPQKRLKGPAHGGAPDAELTIGGWAGIVQSGATSLSFVGLRGPRVDDYISVSQHSCRIHGAHRDVPEVNPVSRNGYDLALRSLISDGRRDRLFFLRWKKYLFLVLIFWSCNKW